MSQKKTCMIGLGLITQRYIKGLDESSYLNICAVSDINENAVSRPMYDRYPFYNDYKQMIAQVKPEYAIISTPPESHFEIASFCLENGVNIVIEKPVTLCIREFDVLSRLAEEKGLVFKTLFHWHGGIETIAFAQKYDLTKIEEIKVSVCDPYCSDFETIDEDRRALMGAWIDSGVNVLSMLRQWLPFEKVEILKTDVQRCTKTQLPVYAKAMLCIDGVQVEIEIDWCQGRDHKESYVKLDGHWVHIDHSQQCIDDVGTTEYGRMTRLDEHYKHQFGTFAGESNVEFSRSVHEILFKVREAL